MNSWQLSHRRFRSFADRTPQRACVALLLCVLLSGCSGVSNEVSDTLRPHPPEPTFAQYEIITGRAKHQTVLPGFLFGDDTAALAVVQVHADGTRHLYIYRFGTRTWELAQTLTLRPEVLFVDVARIGDRDRLITYQQGRLNSLDLDTGTESRLVDVKMHYVPMEDGTLPHIDISRDLNRDGRTDLVVPNVDGFWIATQLADGSFTEPIKLGPPEPFRDEIALNDARPYGEVGINALTIHWYLSRFHELDYNRDGRRDLVFWNGDHFEAYLQDEAGRFSENSVSFTADVPFDADGPYALAFGLSDENTFALMFGVRGTEKRTVLHRFLDMNGDKVADLVTHSLEGRGLTNQRSRYTIYFGTATPSGISFKQGPRTVIRPNGRAAGLLPWGYASQLMQDFDGDGQVDILFRDVNIGLGGMVRALYGNSIALNLAFYRGASGTFPQKPTTHRRIRPDMDVFDPQGVFFPAVLMGDVNGDGRSDLVVGKDWNELHIFPGTPGRSLLTRTPKKLAVSLPADERNTLLVDLNRDGKQDIFIHTPSTTEPNRVTLLIAR